MIRELVKISVRSWTEEQRSQFMELLDNYLTLSDKAVKHKFGTEKERNMQTLLFKKYLTRKPSAAPDDFAFMDFEFQTTNKTTADRIALGQPFFYIATLVPGFTARKRRNIFTEMVSIP